jgi:hypothetical protein
MFQFGNKQTEIVRIRLVRILFLGEPAVLKNLLEVNILVAKRQEQIWLLKKKYPFSHRKKKKIPHVKMFNCQKIIFG